jgi:hypothetical protein
MFRKILTAEQPSVTTTVPEESLVDQNRLSQELD